MSNADLIARLLEAAPVENGQIVLSYDSRGEHIVLDALLREAAAALAEYDLRKFDVGMRDREIARLTSELKERDAEIALLREAKALGLTDRAPTAEDMAWAGQSALDMANAEIARLTSALQERDAMCERAREALEPFAVENEQQERYYPGQHDTRAVWREAYRIMHGDLRRASAVHAELSALGKMETK